MTDREKLFEIVKSASYRCLPSNTTDFHLDLFVTDLLSNGVTFATDTNDGSKWISASEPPEEYRDECGELIPFLVCVDETEYPFRAMYDGKKWGDGLFEITVKWWMPLPEPPKEDER